MSEAFNDLSTPKKHPKGVRTTTKIMSIVNANKANEQ